VGNVRSRKTGGGACLPLDGLDYVRIRRSLTIAIVAMCNGIMVLLMEAIGFFLMSLKKKNNSGELVKLIGDSFKLYELTPWIASSPMSNLSSDMRNGIRRTYWMKSRMREVQTMFQPMMNNPPTICLCNAPSATKEEKKTGERKLTPRLVSRCHQWRHQG